MSQSSPAVGAVTLPAAQHTFELRAGAPKVMGIVNTNPGSFSDREHLATVERQLETALAMVAAGAAIIDVGTDSGVTHGEPIELDTQIARALPLIEELVARDVPVSVDTPFAAVAEAALSAGACLINDVSGLADPSFAGMCAQRGAGLVILHTRVGHKQDGFADYTDVVADVCELFDERIELARAHGLPRDRLLLDPGLGYAKRPEDDLAVLGAYDRLAGYGLALLTGASRKYVTGVITGAAPPQRLPETLAIVETVRRAPGFVRVHDVDEVARYLAVRETVTGLRGLPAYDLDDVSLRWVDPDDGAEGPKPHSSP
ncbi:MAG: dihydropteroate synthase [Actinomycetota bacterium]